MIACALITEDDAEMMITLAEKRQQAGLVVLRPEGLDLSRGHARGRGRLGGRASGGRGTNAHVYYTEIQKEY